MTKQNIITQTQTMINLSIRQLMLVLITYFGMPFISLAGSDKPELPPGSATLTGVPNPNQYSDDNPGNVYPYDVISAVGLESVSVYISSGTGDVTVNGNMYDVKWTSTGAGTLSAAGRDLDGNDFITHLNVTINPLPDYAPAAPVIDSRFCQSTVIKRVGTPPSGDTWEWVSPASGTGATYTATSSGNYKIRAKNSAGYGPKSAAVYADVAQPGTAGKIKKGAEGFESTSATLKLQNYIGDQLTWKKNDGNGWETAGTGATLAVTVTKHTDYKVSVKNDICPADETAPVRVWVFTSPVIQAANSLNGRKTLSVATGYEYYQWILDGQDIYGAVESTYEALESGDYQVRTIPHSATISATSGVKTLDISPINLMPDNPSYMRTESMLEEGITTENDIAGATKQTTTAYMDRMGRTIQTVTQKASPQQYDVVKHHEYNAYGQATKSYLTHVATTTSGAFDPDAATAQSNFYSSGTGKAWDNEPFREVKVERSPAARVLESGGLGEGYQLDEYSTKYEQTYNTSGDQVVKWSLDGSGDLDLTSLPYYANNKLAKQIGKMPEWTGGDEHTVATYTNHRGQKILSRAYVEVDGVLQHLDTYYVYDDYGRLVYIVPPKAVRFSQLPSTEYYDPNTMDIFTSSQEFPAGSAANSTYYVANGKTVTLPEGRTFEEGFDISTIGEYGVVTGYEPVPNMDKYVFKNEYDDKGRLIVKKVPGADEVHYVYDNTGRLILSQDGVQRTNDEWTFTKYDKRDRPVMTGIVTDTRGRGSLQTFIEGEIIIGQRYESRGSALHGYTDDVWPRNVDANDYLVVSYYDDYDFIDGNWNGFGHKISNDINDDPSLIMPHGLETGGKIRVIKPGSTDWLRSVKYYDDDLQLIQGVSDHHRGFKERMYTQYNWLGEVVKTKFTHQVDATKTISLEERFVYDDGGRLIEHYHRTDNEPEVLVAEYHYNELGELIEKNLHKQADDTFVQSVDYRYNIRGQLTYINKANGGVHTGESDDNPDRFGINLYYDSSPSGLTYDTDNPANLAGVAWSHSDMVTDQRSYAYTYDHANRLTGATYNEKDGGSWGIKTNHFNVSDITYDRNGNLKSLSRKHDNTLVDELDYTYDGNQLWNIDDVTNDDEGFKDGAEDIEEYDFDKNGNMTRDANKLIASISYNLLNKPEKITFTSGDHIEYTYDAAGTRLSMSVKIGSSDPYVTDYSSGLIYEEDELHFIAMPQGRIVVEKVADDYNYDYQYHLTDHLGNVRSTVAPLERFYKATMETENADIEENQFLNLAASRNLDAAQAFYGDESAKLNANDDNIIGPAKALKLYAGDVVDLKVFAKYLSTTNADQASTSLAIFDAIASAYGVGGGGEIYNAFQGQLSGAALVAQSAGEVPKAYLNYIFYDKNYENPQTGYTPVTSSSKNSYAALNLSITAPSDGYLFTYLSNESSLDVDVYFDNYSVTHTSSASVMQADDFYPFGLPIASNNYEEPGNETNRFLYQGKEWQTALSLNLYDFHARQYDPATGRFLSNDPKNQFASGYVGMGNMPTMGTDPDGQWVHIVIGAVVGAVTNVLTNLDNIDNIGDYFKYSTTGAAVGAASAATGGAVTGALGGGAAAGSASFGATVAGGAAGGAVSGGLNAGIYGGNLGAGIWQGALGGAIGGAVPSFGAQGVIPGAVAGAAGGALGGGLAGGTINAINGGSFGAGFAQGAKNGALGGALSGGVYGGIAAAKSNRSLLTGNKLYYDRKTGASLQMDPGLVEKFLTDGFTTPDGEHISRDELELTYNKMKRANARYMGLKNGKHHVNLDIGSYETTIHNVKALMVHEVYGHGIMGYSNTNFNHHKAYFASIDSKYWSGTTSTYKAHNVNRMYEYFHTQTGSTRMPMPYHNIFWDHQTLFR